MVSIIVPVYNSEKTIHACVDSIMHQTYKNFELVLINDGSVDRSGPICDEIQATFHSLGMLCTVIHQENGGVSKARNCGMDHVKGEFFVCIDSDDVIEPCYLEDLVCAAESHPELGHVLCGFRCTSHEHDYILNAQERLSSVDRKDYMKLFDAILVQGPWLALYKTEIVHNNAIVMREDLSLAEDIIFNLEYLDALKCTSIGVVNKTNYIYQDEDGNSLYRKFRPNLYAINELVMQSIANYMHKWEINDDVSWQRYYNAALFKYFNVMANTFHPQNTMSRREKIQYNNGILRSDGFRDAINKSDVKLLPSHKRAYLSGNYKRVLAFERFQKMKRALSRFSKKMMVVD